ncbi:hypothetical protein JTE90_016573 [Oedothorax gibbosus]|uniref:Proteasome assembly chaperone 4 n=1 Tax=Oedothorax gibbosus TaxID=931172 RepID=A0AAV6UE49_9ARAC|nr:hypothetical protein JTE90_016573 [Oedothorax gibbosus]
MDQVESEPTIKTHTFDAIINNTPITYHIIHMNSSFFVWIGDQGTFDSLAVAMTTAHSPLPISTVLLGHNAEDSSSSLAARLSKKTGKQVFASCNIAKSDGSLMIGVTQRLIKELEEFPEKF